MPITDPSRLLNGFSFDHALPFCACWVDGCYEEAVVGRLHTRFGPVDACPSHDPAKQAQARLFGRQAPIVAAPTLTPSTPARGGYKVRRPVPVVPRPPMGGTVRPF